MRLIGKIIGGILWFGAGILLFIFWLLTLSRWLGVLGIILAFILSPGLVIFPIIFWIVEDIFPTVYFTLWGISIIGLIIFGISSKDD